MKNTFLQFGFILLLSVVVSTVLAWVHPWDRAELQVYEGENALEIQEVLSFDETPLWVDAREQTMYDQGTIPGAIHLNHDNFEQNILFLLEKWQPGSRIVVFCDTLICDKSREIADRLEQEMGLTDVYVLKGGWESWKRR